jgi:hypothetical protein
MKRHTSMFTGLPQGWYCIGGNHSHASWLAQNNPASWCIKGPGLYWLAPELYTLWLLKFGNEQS